MGGSFERGARCPDPPLVNNPSRPSSFLDRAKETNLERNPREKGKDGEMAAAGVKRRGTRTTTLFPRSNRRKTRRFIFFFFLLTTGPLPFNTLSRVEGGILVDSRSCGGPR